jgi:hypothetical protein
MKMAREPDYADTEIMFVSLPEDVGFCRAP